MKPEPGTEPTEATQEFDHRDARTEAGSDRAPTPDEEAAAPVEVSPSVRDNYRNAIERGAAVKGEGQIP
jgi:hypothetical protein